MHLTMDYETRSPEEIDKGPWKYFEHPCTQILMTALKIDNRRARIWLPQWLMDQYPVLAMVFDVVSDEEFKSIVAEAKTIEAHNAMFERAGWETILEPRGFGSIDPRTWRCSAANAARFKFPRNLEGACEALNVVEKKDSEGHDLMKKMCSPIFYDQGNPFHPVYRESADDFIRLIAYCLQDVEAEYALSRALPPMPKRDLETWFLDQKINANGVLVDVESLKLMQEHRGKHFGPLLERFAEITGGLRPTQDKKFKTWLIEEKEVEVPDLRADTVELMIADTFLPEVVREALEIRSVTGKSSLAKVDKMLSCACRDGRVRDILMYHGAGPGRWTGKGIQLQNFPRASTNLTEDIPKAMRDLSPATFNLAYGPIGPAMVKCLRGMIIASRGRRMLDADFSSIEARFAAWITEDENVLEIFRTHGKVYEATAAVIFGCEIDDIGPDSQERLIGKVGDLSLTYQGGVAAYVGMGRTYRLDLRTVADAVMPTVLDWEYEKSEALVEKMFPMKKLKDLRITKEIAIACDVVKVRWRGKRPLVTNAWYALEDCAKKAVMHKGSIFQWNGIYFGVQDDFLCVKLPSGRSMYYYKPRIQDNIPPWVDKKNSTPAEINMQKVKNVAYLGAKGKHGLKRISMHGGKWFENICQGGCADFLSYSMKNVDEAGYTVLFTVHDEVPAEADDDFGSLEHFIAEMNRVPDWASDFPLVSDGWEGKRFKK